MTSTDAYANVRQTLRQELQRRRGQIHAIESGLSRSEGYLAKVCRGDISIPLEVLLKSLELLGTEPSRFFGRALGSSHDPAEALLEVASPEPDRSVTRLLTAVHELASMLSADDLNEPTFDVAHLLDTSSPSTAVASAPEANDPADAPSVEIQNLTWSVLDKSTAEQRRRLRSAQRYRRIEFARCYLDALESRRQHEPRNVAKLAESVAIDLVPQIDASPRERLELLLGAAKAHAAARRAIGNEGAAAALLYGCLRSIEPLQWPAETALLLQRAVTLLTNTGHYPAALACQERAQGLFTELGRERDVGRLLLQRAMLQSHMGSASGMRRSLARSLELLGPVSETTASSPKGNLDRLFRVSAFHMLASDCRQREDLNSATQLLEQAALALGESSGNHFARLVWERALLEIELNHPSTAEALLSQCRAEFIRLEDPATALVTLDLIDLLLEEGRPQAAKELAVEMVQCVQRYESHPANEAALMAFLRTVIEGKLNEQLTATLRRSLSAGRSSQTGKVRAGEKATAQR